MKYNVESVSKTYYVNTISTKDLKIEIAKLKKEVMCTIYQEKKDCLKYNNEPYHSIHRECKSLEGHTKELEGNLVRLEIESYYEITNQCLHCSKCTCDAQ